MKCEVCRQDGLRWYSKLLMAFTLPMKCKLCDARYELGSSAYTPPEFIQSAWEFLMDWLEWFVLLLMLGVVYLTSYLLIWPAAVVLGLIALLSFTWLSPHRLNSKDPVNDLVLRIQDKKRQIEAAESN